MTQLELPLNTLYTVRVTCTVDFSILSNSSKEAVQFVKGNFFPQLTRPKVIGVWRSEQIPAEVQDSEPESDPPRQPPPRGRPPGGTLGGGSMKPAPKLVDVVAKVVGGN